ncbi:MAG: hypothetical protein AAGA48_04255 [Myxococcota bacterium]
MHILLAVPYERAVWSGRLTLSRNLGLMAGASLMGGIFARVSGLTQAAGPALAVSEGLRVIFGLGAILLLFGGILVRWMEARR